MNDEHIDHVLELYNNRKNVDKEAYVASYEDIVANDYNLNIPRYVDTTEEEEEIDLAALISDIKETDKTIKETNSAFISMLKDLSFTDETDKCMIENLIEILGEE